MESDMRTRLSLLVWLASSRGRRRRPLRARRPNVDVLGDSCDAAEDGELGVEIDAGCAEVFFDDEWPGRKVLLRDDSGFNELGKWKMLMFLPPLLLGPVLPP